MKVAIMINEQRLTPQLKTQLDGKDLSEKYDLSYDVFIVKPEQLEKSLREVNYEKYNAFLIGGGDGTVCTAARILAPTNLPLIILPLGTFNVLAKSLGYPNDLDAIFNIIKNNKTKLIDLGKVNELTFINHAWLGNYTYIIKVRERHKEVLGKSKLLKMIVNTFLMFRRIPVYKFEILVNDKVQTIETCLIFISNNESIIDLFNFGTRPLLATGLLHVSIVDCHTRWQLLKCILKLIFTHYKNLDCIRQFSVNELLISTTHPEVNIVLDGELTKLKTPLHFANQKNTLNVIVP